MLLLPAAGLAQLIPKAKQPEAAVPQPAPDVKSSPGQPLAILRIGHVAPLTGQIAHLGQDNENGARLAVEEINAAGGIKVGDRTYRLQIVGMDDKATPSEGVRAAQELIDLRITAVVGHLNSGTSIPASKIYFDGRVPQISPSATNPKFTQLGFDTSFRVVANDDHQAVVLAQYAVKRLGAKRIAIVDDRTAYGAGLADNFERYVRRLGAEVVAREFVNTEKRNFTSVVLNLEPTVPDVVFYGGMDAEAGPLAVQMRRAGMNSILLSGDGACSPEFIQLARGSAEQMHCSMSGEAVEKFPRGDQFQAKFKRRFKVDVQIYSPYSYDAVYVIADALRRAGSTQPDALIRAIRQTNLEGLTGPIRFDAKGDLVNGAVSIFRVRNGKLEYLETLR
ncbi:MAG TPA: branched-chain amino acid ABC transporter substrate-binding protein [Burkholderiaceae bacterium]|nr:branched-chain amino acid ABC transporter substrate-binding protein [Burkholderiaceae bacterium]